MASSKETYCLCGQPYNIGQFMIECDCCREWFHGSCVDVKIYQSDDIDKYHCPKCAQTYGPSVLKIPTNNHRSDRYELGAESRPAQAGSPAWVRALAARPPRSLPSALQRLRGHQFTEEFVRDNGFTKPILFSSPDGLDMKVPNSATFTSRSVLRYCGAQLEVEVIDVRKQSTLRMSLGEYVDYLETAPETRVEKVLNVISLEFSETNMSSLVEPPATMRALDWSRKVWPSASPPSPRAGGGPSPRSGGGPSPAVGKYCLLSAAGAYTDWHLDFGGTAVWYHVLRGGKIFYLAPPTATNLALYQQWSASNNQNERFFGDMVEWYGTAELTAGSTLVIPSGWIHAVMTPTDSLVLGGNLLHSYAIEMQLQIYEIERRVETPMMFRYPLFETLHWYAGAHLLQLLRRHNEESQDEDFTISDHEVQAAPAELPPLLLRGIKILANALKEWHALKATDTAKRDNVPKCLNSGQLVRELCKELRTLEKRSTTTHKDKDYKVKNSISPKAHSKKPAQKKSLKLTLPKPIMHMHSHINGEYPEEKIYEKPYIENKEIIYQDPRYITQEMKYETLEEAGTFVVDGKGIVMPSDKTYIYTNYEEQIPVYAQEANGYEPADKKNGSSVLRIKMNNSPSSSRDAPPPYSLPEHSILKSHLTSRGPPLTPSSADQLDRVSQSKLQQWTISKKDIGDYHEEQILFTNDNLQAVQPEMAYGPGMYSAEDIQQDYQYVVDGKQTTYPAYSYLLPRETYPAYIEAEPIEQQQQATAYNAVPVTEAVNGYHHELPTYDAAIAQQYGATNYVIEEQVKSASSPPVRRSERPVRRRVSATYDYEDAELYIDEAPPPRRRRAKQPRPAAHRPAPSNSSSNNYRQPPPPPPPQPPPPARPAVNGIESLIQASVLAEEPPTDTEDAAVAGMLSIGEQRYTAPQRTFGLAADNASHHSDTALQNSISPSSSKRQRKGLTSGDGEDPDDEQEDIIKEVHRDDEYVYPSLEMSSSEEEEEGDGRSRRGRSSRTRSDVRGKNDKDTSWSPRARLGRLVPRLRSGRAVQRRECVRAALHHARHAVSVAPVGGGGGTGGTAADKDKPQMMSAKRSVLASKSRRPPPTTHAASKNKSDARLKKGMKTAKQRLGKILKIHKMIY